MKHHFNSFYESELAAARSFDVENMNYEQLSSLCEKMGSVKCGVPKETFDRIPTRTLYASAAADDKKHQQQQQTQKSVSHHQNTVGISRLEEMEQKLQLYKKDPPTDGSDAIRLQRLRMMRANYVDEKSNSSIQPAVVANKKPNPLLKEACCICMTNLVDPDEHSKKGSKIKTLPCKHSFHAPCIKQWLVDNKTCPVCKADVARQAASVGSLLFQLLPPK